MKAWQALFLLSISGLWSCASRPTARYQPVAAATPAPAQQLFLSCRLSAAASGTRVEVLQMEAVVGELKTPPPAADTPDFVRVLQLDKQGQSLAQATLPHPLRRSVEHVGDDQRTFQRSELVLPSAEFFVRLALRPDAVTIRIEESAGGKTALLTDIPIPPKS